MKKRITCAIVLALLLAASNIMADVDIERLNMVHRNGETALKIALDGVFQFSHETAEATPEKPFRVIVDIFPAVHKLEQKNFGNLPESIIRSIRTSQYSVNPDKIVRVVLDLNETVLYRTETVDNAIWVYIPDKTGPAFSEWSTADVNMPLVLAASADRVPGPARPEPAVTDKAEPPDPAPIPPSKAVEEEPAEPEKSDQPEPAPPIKKEKKIGPPELKKTKPVLAQETTEAKPAPPPAPETVLRYYRPYKSLSIDREIYLARLHPVRPIVEPPVELAGHDPDTPEPMTADDEADTDDPMTPAPVPEVTREIPSMAGPVAPVTRPDPMDTIPVVASASTPAPETAPAASPEETVAAKDTVESKPTSRFRRQPAFPAKLKGTIVAEFPQRMVIRYGAGKRRDPFRTLIDDTKKSDSPIHKKIPDVETSRLVGILEASNGEYRALLEDFDGYGYILKKGDKIKKGYVSKIDASKAFFRLFEYGWSRTVALYLGQN